MLGLQIDITERKLARDLLEGQKEILEMVAKGLPLSDNLEAIARHLETLRPGMMASILLLDPDGVHLRHGAAPSLPVDYTAAVDGAAIGPCAGSSGTAAYRREQVIVTDIAVDPLWKEYRDLALGHGLRACWSTPIFSADGEVLGTFAMYHNRPLAASPEDLRLVESTVGLASVAIERSHARTELQAANAELRAINRVLSTATRGLDLEGVFREVLKQVLELSGLEGGTLCLLGPGDIMELAIEQGASEATIYDLTNRRVKVGDCLCGTCARDCKPLILSSQEEVLTYATRESGRGEGIQFHAAFPLIARGGCLGVLCVFTRTDKKSDARALRLLEALTAHAAVAVRNAQLFQEVQGHAAELEGRVRERTARLKNANASLRAAMERAESADRAKSAFLAAMSHELRTPLNSIIGFTGAVLDGLVGAVSPEQRDALEIVKRNGQHLRALINDVLDLSKVEAGEMRLSNDSLDLAEVVRESVQTMEHLALAKGLSLSLDGAEQPAPCLGDRRRVAQAMVLPRGGIPL